MAKIVYIKQASGATRLLALNHADAIALQRDPAMIESIKPLGAVDVFRDGIQEWGCTGPRYRDIPADVRADLEYAAKQ